MRWNPPGPTNRSRASWSLAFAALLAIVLLPGCADRAQRQRTEWLAAWLNSQSYSTWFTFRSRDDTPARPAADDGLTLGSPHVFAAVGCGEDLAAVDLLWADEGCVRVLAKPLRVGVKEGREQVRFLHTFPRQRLRRVRHTAIAVSDSEADDLRVSIVDFAPRGKDDSFLARWFLVQNTGGRTRRLSLVLEVTAPGDWVRRDSRSWQVGDHLGIVCDKELSLNQGRLEARLGKLRPGARTSLALLMVGGRDRQHLSRYLARAEAGMRSLPDLLEETRADWEQWCGRTLLRTGDERTDDLLDSLLCLVRSHVHTRAIHTGSLYYSHGRAWVRDNYWVQRALLELGLVEEARLNLDFFHRAWQKSGVCSYYEVADLRGQAYGYMRVEVPHYLVLMVRDAEELGRVDGARYWDMVRACLDNAAVPADGLQPMNGDETWLLAAPVRELDALLDNSWLLIASAEYGARLAQKVGDQPRAARYGELAYRARLALRQFMPTGRQPPWYAIGRAADGSLDFSLCPEVFARGAILGVLPADDPRLVAGLMTSWEYLAFERGIRTHVRSATISGGTPGYVLYAAADSPACDAHFNRELAERVLNFASATGCVWEYHDLYDPNWGGEKRRLWDSAVLLMGLTHALFDIEYQQGTVSFSPKPPAAVVKYTRPAGGYPVPLAMARKLAGSAELPVILEQDSPEHAAWLARELARQYQRLLTVSPFRGELPEDKPAIVISPFPPPDGWEQPNLSYWWRRWDGPPQFWVMNLGHVYQDTAPLLRDLLPAIPPARARPMRFPDANLDLASRLGEEPVGSAELSAKCGDTVSASSVQLRDGSSVLRPRGAEVTVATSWRPSERLVVLTVSAGPRSRPLELSITLPQGWWVVRARDMTGQWDRVEDPAGEWHLPDGRVQLTYSFRASATSVSTAFDLARLGYLRR